MKSFVLIVALMLGITNLSMGRVQVVYLDNKAISLKPVELAFGAPAVTIRFKQDRDLTASTIEFPPLDSVKFDPNSVAFSAGLDLQYKSVTITATEDVEKIILSDSWSFTVTGTYAPASFPITINAIIDVPITFASGGETVKAIELTYGQPAVKIKFTMVKENKAYLQINWPQITNVRFSPHNSIGFTQYTGDNLQNIGEISASNNVAAVIPANTWSFGKDGNGAPYYKLFSFDITIIALQNIPITFVTGGAVGAEVTDVQVTYGEPAVKIRFTQATAGAATIEFPSLIDIKFDPNSIAFSADGGNNQMKDVAITATKDFSSIQKWSFKTTGLVLVSSFPITIVEAPKPKPKTPTVVLPEVTTKPPTELSSDDMAIIPNVVGLLCAVISIFF